MSEMPDKIDSAVLPYRYSDWGQTFYEPGEVIVMPNGETWFHPYTGARPVQIEDSEQVTKQ